MGKKNKLSLGGNMTTWICENGKATNKELQERFGDGVTIKPLVEETQKSKKPKQTNNFEVNFRPKKWFEIEKEVWIDTKLRDIFSKVEIKTSRSFNGFIENFAISDNITADEKYYLKTGNRKIWIGYKGNEPFADVIKRIFLKGIKMGLIPTAWED